MHRLHARRAAAAVGLLGAALLGLAPVAPAASGVTRTKPFARPPYLRGDAAPQGARILALPPTLAPAPGIPMRGCRARRSPPSSRTSTGT